ncbi:MAG TPA: hypothetical protein VNO52_06930, partial [Methylomirabilota bacterium]|nr:hypothetical protein [Methylomirabilota bacterium]
SFVQYTRPLPVTVSQIPLLVASTLSRLTVTALPAGSDSAAAEAETKIRVERRAGFSGDVDLALEGAPPGVKTVLDRIPAGVTETALKITASEKTPAGTNTLVVIGSGRHGDRHFTFRSSPITLIVTPPEEEARPSLVATNASGAAVVPARQP